MSNPMSNSQGWSIADWITAVATSATAVIGLFAYRRSSRSGDPIIESDEPRWLESGNIVWRITVRNRSAMAHRLLTAHISKPKDARFSIPQIHSLAGMTSKILDLSGITIYPAGTAWTAGERRQEIDQIELSFVVDPPPGWAAGKLRLELSLADKSSRPRQRRFVISKLINATSNKTSEDIVKRID